MNVINCKKKFLQQLGYKDLEDWLNKDPKHVYIGRNMSFYVKGANKSKWANPFSVKKFGREECLGKYRNYLLQNKKLLSELKELKGCTLACWCKPESCHGDILVELMQKLNL
jgi:hypothetical protein